MTDLDCSSCLQGSHVDPVFTGLTFFRQNEVRVRHHKWRSLRKRRYWLSNHLWNNWLTLVLIYSLVISILVTIMTKERGVQDLHLHLEYPVCCSEIMKGDPEQLDLVRKLYEEVAEISVNGLIPIPSDRYVVAYATNCDFFKEQRKYPQRIASREEEQYPLAFVIVVHRNAAQVEKLLRALYQPQNVYAIHPDAKSSPDFIKAIRKLASCLDNVIVCSTLEDVHYGRQSRLVADINCMRDLITHPVQWKYVFNQCGEAFPLKTNLEMVRQLKSYNGLNDVESYLRSDKELNRFHRYGPDMRLTVGARLQHNPHAPPGDIKLFSGNAYNSLTRGFMEYVLSEELPQMFLEWLEDVWYPEEHYWASLNRVPGIPGGSNESTMDLTTYVNRIHGHRHVCNGWNIHHLCVFSSADLNLISSMPHLFVNNIYYFKDPIALQCLQDSLTNRAHREQSWLPW